MKKIEKQTVSKHLPFLKAYFMATFFTSWCDQEITD
jgi:hypothetical protein